MTPDFALSLSTDGICLLERAEPKWVVLGQIDLSDADFHHRVTKLREKALAKSSSADRVKLVIPNEQIKYYSLARPSDTLTAEIEALIIKSLIQETPYPISEIAFDWVTSRKHIFVAAVALKTLQEAETFAKQQGFTALGNIAIPPANEFIGEAFFGLSDGTQNKMGCDFEKINLSTSKEAAPKYAQTSPSLGNRVSYKAPVEIRENNNAAEPVQSALETQAKHIVFQSVRDVQLRQLENEGIYQDKSSLTLIAPIEQDIPQALASFDSQNLTTASLPSRFVNFLYGKSQNAQSTENHYRLMNAGFLPAFLLIIATVCLVGVGIFYLAKPTVLRIADQIKGPPPSPVVTIKLALPRNLSTSEQKIVLSDKFKQSSQLSKHFLVPPIIPDVQGVVINPYLDLTNRQPPIGVKHKLISQLVLEPNIKQSKLLEDYNIDRSVTLRPTSAPDTLDLPKQDSKFGVFREKQSRMYSSNGIWPISPIAPNPVISTYLRSVPIASHDLNVVRPQVSSLGSSTDFETNPEIVALALSPTVGINLNSQQTKIEKTTNNSAANSDITQMLSTFPPIFPENSPQLHPVLSNKHSPDMSLTTVSTQVQETTLQLKRDNETVKQQKQKTSKIEFAVTVKLEAQSRLHSQPAELKKPMVDTVTEPLTGGPITNIRPLPRPEDSDLTIANKSPAVVLRPKPRPDTIKPLLPVPNEDKASASLRPKQRPDNVKPVKPALVANAFSPEDEGDEATVGNDAPSSKPNKRVSSKATIVNVLDLRQINLLGVYLSSGKRSALIRLSSGKRIVVKVGDSFDGGKVAAIGDREIRYIKRGQNITLELPKG